MIETKRKVEQVIQTAQKHRQDQRVQRMEFQKSTKSEWYFADMCSRFVDFFFCRIRVVLNFPHFVAPPKLSTERRKLTGGHRACPGSCFGYSWGCVVVRWLEFLLRDVGSLGFSRKSVYTNIDWLPLATPMSQNEICQDDIIMTKQSGAFTKQRCTLSWR